eukprot:CAMPEP_0203808908 /NCGR_PEP_ID=MMETSP0115-20131106/1900_1 /ASSEMBLY_ACC=CAM_ASM_000227 /TAXON_ID=33651 /ORGANISM="Bicosoecid sp, Strain ms1" /LENGTH=208 /DNA_ID=CAMNT_0050717613 /DNA_START=15 /DNA_END=641 /DNA_ORIENTATION=-
MGDDSEKMYAYYQAKLDEALFGEDTHVQDAAILDCFNGLPYAYSTSLSARIPTGEDDEGKPIYASEDPDVFGPIEEAVCDHWDGSGSKISEAEYITSVFFEGDGQLQKFFYRGKRYMITRRIAGDQFFIASPDVSDYPAELAPLIYGKAGKTAACIMRTPAVMIIATCDVDSKDFSKVSYPAIHLAEALVLDENAAAEAGVNVWDLEE